jgi:hypothetical protein
MQQVLCEWLHLFHAYDSIHARGSCHRPKDFISTCFGVPRCMHVLCMVHQWLSVGKVKTYKQQHGACMHHTGMYVRALCCSVWLSWLSSSCLELWLRWSGHGASADNVSYCMQTVHAGQNALVGTMPLPNHSRTLKQHDVFLRHSAAMPKVSNTNDIPGKHVLKGMSTWSFLGNKAHR